MPKTVNQLFFYLNGNAIPKEYLVLRVFKTINSQLFFNTNFYVVRNVVTPIFFLSHAYSAGGTFSGCIRWLLLRLTCCGGLGSVEAVSEGVDHNAVGGVGDVVRGVFGVQAL